MNKQKARQILDCLVASRQPRTELEFKSEFEAIVAVMLSAQCPDKTVNKVTPALFKAYPSFKTLAAANLSEVEKLIAACNFYKNKAKNIIGMADAVLKNFNGSLPKTIDELIMLPGVGRKSAQVVLVEVFNVPAVPVDTHVFRTCARMGISPLARNVLETEVEIRAVFEPQDFNNLHKSLVLHGRYVCKAKKPACAECAVRALCESYNKL